MRLMLLLCVLLFPSTVFAELVELKSGEVYSGEIVDRNDEYVTIKSGGAPIYLPVDQIKEHGKEVSASRQAVNACEGSVQVLYDNGRYEEALAEIVQCNQLDPKEISLWYLRGLIHQKLKQPEEAIQAFLQCLKINSKYIQVYSPLARLYNETHQYKEAARFAGKVINIDHWNKDAYLQLKIARAFLENPALDLDQFLVTVKKGEELSLAAGTAFNEHKYDQAQALYEQAVALVPYDVFSTSILGLLADWKGDAPAKVKYTKRALELNPYDEDTYRTLSITMPRLGRADELKDYPDPKTLE